MRILEKLKKQPGFPIISQVTFNKLKEENARTIRKSKRLRHLGLSIAEQEEANKELTGLEKEELLYDACIENLQNGLSIYEILEDFGRAKKDDGLLQEILEYWEQQFTDALQYESKPLGLLPLLLSNLSTEALFSALILCLLRKGLRAEEIIASELIHRYFGDNLHKLYTSDEESLLSKVSQPASELESLLRKMDTILINIPGIGTITLSGKKIEYNPGVPTLKLNKLKFSFTLTQENWDALYKSFGQVFLLQVLVSKSSSSIDYFFQNTVQVMPIDEIKALFNAIQTEVAAERRKDAIKTFSRYTTKNQSLALLEVNHSLLWIMLITKPSLIEDLTQEQLDGLIKKNSVISLLSASDAMQCAQKPQFKSYGEQIHLAVLDCLMKHATTEIDTTIINQFRENPKASLWCEKKHHELMSQFKDLIAENIPLTGDSYINIMDFYRVIAPQLRLVEKLSPILLQYPRDNYGAQSYILDALYEARQLELGCLDIFYSEDVYATYGEEERKKAKVRALLTSLTEQDNEPLQLWIIQQLQTHFAVTDWRSMTIAFLTKAIEHEKTALLKAYYQNIPADSLLQDINKLDEKGSRILNYAVKYPKSFQTILSLLPEADRLAACKEKDNNGQTVLHEASSNPESLKTILSLYPETERLAVCKEKDNNGQTVLHEAATNPESLKTILSLYPETERLAACKEKDNNGKTVLHCAASKPESLKTILSLYPETERLAACKEKDRFRQKVLHCAASNPESLKTILSLYPETDRLAACKEKDICDLTVLHNAASNPESLKTILSLLPEIERLAACKEKDGFGNTVLHYFSSNPESLKTILSLYPETERLEACKEKYNGKTVLHAAATNPESLKTILSLLPEADRLAACKEKDRFGQTVLHEAATNPESLKTILSLYPETERLAACKEKGIFGKTVLHAAATNPESLKTILSLLLEVPFNILIKDLSDLNFIVPFIAMGNIDLARFSIVFLSENIQQNTESFKFASSNPSEFLRCYFRLQEIIENQTNPAAQWLQDIITGKCEFDKIIFQSYRSSLDKSPLSEIFHEPSLQSLFSRLNQTTFKEQLTTFREENIEKHANVDATVPRKS